MQETEHTINLQKTVILVVNIIVLFSTAIQPSKIYLVGRDSKHRTSESRSSTDRNIITRCSNPWEIEAIVILSHDYILNQWERVYVSRDNS